MNVVDFRLPLLLCAFTLLAAGCNAPAPQEAAAESPPAGAVEIAFSDVTHAAGLHAFAHQTGAVGEKWMPETMGSGGGFLDYDGDGWLDILLVGGGTWDDAEDTPALWLYHNNQDGSFSLRSKEAGLEDITAYGMGITAADYDNDGDEDFFFTTLRRNMLFRNDSGTFTEVGQAAGLAEETAWSTSALFFDADHDGHLDLYVGNYVDWAPEKDIWCTLDGEEKSYCAPTLYDGLPGRFYHNNGDGTFTDRTEAAGFLPAPGKTLGVAELDFNRDGWPDLVMANDLQRDLLYENNGDGTFTEIGMLSGIAFDEKGMARGGMGIDAGDVDNDGRTTVFVGNFSNEMIGVYRHAGSGLFLDQAAASGIGPATLLSLTFGLFLFDPDLDGDLDLFVANGHIQDNIEKRHDAITYRQPPQLFINRDGYVFEDAGPRLGGVWATTLVARGAAYGDYDRDGDPDLLITENGGPAHLWRNDLITSAAGEEASPPHVLRVRLQGRQSNRDGIGARVVAVRDGLHISRHIRTGSSYLSQSEKTATFGLGTQRSVDSLMVYWPSGQVDVFTNVPAGQEIEINEGRPAFTRRTLHPRPETRFAGQTP